MSNTAIVMLSLRKYVNQAHAKDQEMLCKIYASRLIAGTY
jgi:hypothetical protein